MHRFVHWLANMIVLLDKHVVTFDTSCENLIKFRDPVIMNPLNGFKNFLYVFVKKCNRFHETYIYAKPIKILTNLLNDFADNSFSPLLKLVTISQVQVA